MPAAPGPLLRIRSPEAALFASDMHLDDAQPQSAAHFFEHLDAALAKGLAQAGVHGAPALFLLGDLFEYWVGDDHEPAVALALAGRLTAFVSAGGRAFLMHGNRDFLLDAPLPSPSAIPSFTSRCGATLLDDPSVVEVAGRRVGLSHGDGLCTDDTRYQQWRALCRSQPWQQQFLSRPIDERLAMAQALRQQSMQAQAVTETLSDVNQEALDALMTLLDTPLLIHGHTHKPMLHRWDRRLRWVLSDWSASPPRGEVLPLSAIERAQQAQ
jgi:UDP-2,3-diacylglucosamine hydrolase